MCGRAQGMSPHAIEHWPDIVKRLSSAKTTHLLGLDGVRGEAERLTRALLSTAPQAGIAVLTPAATPTYARQSGKIQFYMPLLGTMYKFAEEVRRILDVLVPP